jgi:ankyrin repeat protein
MADRKTDPRFYAFRDIVRSDLAAAAAMLAADPELVRLRNELGETAMHYLAVENRPQEVAWLITRGAEVDPQNQFQQTPLMEVAALGLLNICRLLVSRGANYRYVNARGESVLSSAASTDQEEIVEYLLALLPLTEDINPLFDNVEAEMAVKHSPKSAVLLIQRGLMKRWS